jgi:hypothetical protein
MVPRVQGSYEQLLSALTPQEQVDMLRLLSKFVGLADSDFAKDQGKP